MEVLEKKHALPSKLAPSVDQWRWCVGPMQEALDESGEDWHRLALATHAPPTALPLWYASSYEAFGQIDGPVSVHRLYAGARLVAVLPLSFNRRICRAWLPYQNRKYTTLWAFPFDGEVEGASREIQRHLLSTADMLDLEYMLEASGPVPHLVDHFSPSRMLLESSKYAADVYNPLDAEWDQCLTHMASRLARQTRQNRRWFRRRGDLVLDVHTDPDGLERLLTECLDLEKAGWKGRNGTAIGCLPDVEHFYRTLAHHAARAGLLGLYTLRLDSRLLAFNLSLRTGKRIDAMKIAYDETMSRKSPGNVMNYTILERECQEGRFASFHWGNPSRFKARWTDCSNRLVRVLMFSRGVRGYGSRLAHIHARPFVRQCRETLSRVTGEASQ